MIFIERNVTSLNRRICALSTHISCRLITKLALPARCAECLYSSRPNCEEDKIIDTMTRNQSYDDASDFDLRVVIEHGESEWQVVR